MRRKKIPFATKLTFYVLSIATLLFLCIAIVFGRYSRQREESQAVDYTYALQEILNQKITQQLEDVEQDVADAAQAMRRLRRRPEKMMPELVRMVRSDSLVKAVYVAYAPGYLRGEDELLLQYAGASMADGREKVLTESFDKTEYDYSSKAWFAKTMAAKRSIWATPYQDMSGRTGNHNDRDKEKVVITFAYPMMDDDDVFAVIAADVTLSDLSLNMSNTRAYPESRSFVVGSDGSVIIPPDLSPADLDMLKKNMQAGRRGNFVTTVDGGKVLACYAPLARTGWIICSITPYAVVQQQLRSAMAIMAIIMLVGLVLLALCIRLLMIYVAAPMEKLAMDTLKKNERIESDLRIAHDIQMDIVPKRFAPFAACENLDLYALIRPAREVGGDFYDFILRDGKLFFCIGDVAGKGVPASLVMAITSTLFRMTAVACDSPDKIAERINKVMAHDNDANIFVTMFVGELCLTSGKLTYCNAGHNPPLLVDADGGSRYLPTRACLPVGVLEDAGYSSQATMLDRNQTLLLYTDGLTEGENAAHEQFGMQRMQASASQCSLGSVRQMMEQTLRSLTAFVDGAEQSDDLTMLGIRLSDVGNVSQLVLTNDVAQAERLVPFIEDIGERLQLPASLVMKLNLALEEALVNVMQYAYPVGVEGSIELRATWHPCLAKGKDACKLTFVLTDEGGPFDPTQAVAPDVSLGVEDRPVGGLGIFMMRKLMDEVVYQRDDGKNRLIMAKLYCKNEK